MVYLYNLLSLALCWLYFVYRRKLGRVWHDNLLRFTIFGSILAVIQFLLMLKEAYLFSFLYIFYFYISLLILAVRLVVEDTKQKIARTYKTIKENAPGSIKIKKLDNNQYSVTLKWIPLAIAKRLQNFSITLTIIFYKLLDWLHQYLPFVPGDHHLVHGVPKRQLNTVIDLLKRASKKIKIKTTIAGIVVDDYFLRLIIEVNPKNKKNWYQDLQEYFLQYEETSDLNFRKEKVKMSKQTITILLPRPDKND